EPLPQPCAERDELGVDVGPGPADRLHVHLPELAVAPGLRRLMAEHRPEAPELVALAAQQTVGDERAHDAGRGLGTEREALAAATPVRRVPRHRSARARCRHDGRGPRSAPADRWPAASPRACYPRSRAAAAHRSAYATRPPRTAPATGACRSHRRPPPS